MKKFAKAALAWMLCIAMLASFTPIKAYGASSLRIVQCPCVSDRYTGDRITLYTDGLDLYIDIEMVKKLTGYYPEKFGVSSKDVTFCNSYWMWSAPVTIPYDFMDGTIGYFRLDNIMRQLNTSVFEKDGAIVFISERATFQDLRNLCYEIYFGQYKGVAVRDDDWDEGIDGTTAREGAVLYNIITSFGFSETISYLSGQHEIDQYKDVFASLTKAAKGEWETLAKLSEKLLGVLSKAADLGLDTKYGKDNLDGVEDLGELFGLIKKGDRGEYILKSAGKAVEILTNPVGELLGELLKGQTEGIEELTGKSLSIEGLDIFTWLGIMNYLDSIVLCTSTEYKMYDYAFYTDGVIDTRYTPAPARIPLEDIRAMYLSDEYAMAEGIMFCDLLTEVLSQTSEKVIGGAVVKTILGFSNPESIIFSIAQSTLKLVYDELFQASDRMDYVEQAIIIRELQESIRSRIIEKIGGIADGTADPLAFKYLTMLYLRLSKLNQHNLTAAAGDNAAAADSLQNKCLKELYMMDDADLVDGFTVERIPVQANDVKESTQKTPAMTALADLIGQPFTKVEEIYGENEWFENEAGICLDYEMQDDIIYCICDWVDEEWWSEWESQKDKVRVDEIDWITYKEIIPKERVITGELTTYMGEPQIREYLQGYTFEKWTEKGASWDGTYYDDTYLSAQSDQYYILFHWSANGASGVNNTAGMPVAVYITSMEARKNRGFLVEEDEAY